MLRVIVATHNKWMHAACICLPPISPPTPLPQSNLSLLSQTYIGSVVVSVNPYKTLDIYDANTMEQYRGINFYELPPHLYVFLSFLNPCCCSMHVL